MMRDKEFLLVTQHFHPTGASGGKLLAQLMPRILGNGLKGRVLTSNLAGGARRDVFRGLDVRRLRAGGGRRGMLMRGLWEILFTLKAAVWVSFCRRPDVVVVLSSPPFLPYLIGPVCKLRGIPYLYIMYDLYPDVLALMGKMNERSLIYKIWDGVSKLALRWAAVVVVLGRCMKRHINGKYSEGLDNLRIVHNWSDKDAIYPISKSQNHYFRESILPSDKFVVQYSGNIGRMQDFDVILRAAELLKDHDDIVFFIVGSGNRSTELDAKVAALGQSNIIRLPFQDEELKNDLLNAADVSVITLNEGMERISMPSKFYPIIAAGVPVISVINAESEIPYVVAEENIGINVTDRSGQELADKILAIKDGSIEFADPRESYLQRFDLDAAVGHYRGLIDEILQAP